MITTLVCVLTEGSEEEEREPPVSACGGPVTPSQVTIL